MIATEKDKTLILKIISEKIKKGFFLQKKVVIFGCTIYAKTIRNVLQNGGIQISAFLDNNMEKVGKDCLGIRVYTPDAFLIPYKPDVIVIVCSKYNYEMIEQLKEIGYSTKCILEITIAESQIAKGDSLEVFTSELEQVNRGYILYQNVCKNRLGKF